LSVLKKPVFKGREFPADRQGTRLPGLSIPEFESLGEGGMILLLAC